MGNPAVPPVNTPTGQGDAVGALDAKPVKTQTAEELDARSSAFARIFERASRLLRMKFGSAWPSFQYKVQASLPGTDARTAGGGIRYYQTVQPTERIAKNRNVPKGTQNIEQGVTLSGEIVRKRTIDTEGHYNVFLSPLLKSSLAVLVYSIIAQIEAKNGGSRTPSFAADMVKLGFKPVEKFAADGTTPLYTSKGERATTWNEVRFDPDSGLENELLAILNEVGPNGEKLFDIPVPMDWQAFSMAERLATRGKVVCPTAEHISFAMSEAQFNLVNLSCKEHKQPLVYTAPVKATTAAEPGTKDGVGLGQEAAA